MTLAPARYPNQAAIEAYGNGGFRFAGMSHRGSILCLPSGIYAWSPRSFAEVDAEALLAAATAAPAPSLLILGTGRQRTVPGASLAQAFAGAGIGLEAMDTGAACRTYNVLLAEGRLLGAALIAVA
jgi:uncharacterized protein